MGHQALVEALIQDGRRLIDALDRTNFPLDTAHWSYFPESDEWRLVLSSPRVAERGPLESYGKVQQVMLDLKRPLSFSLSDVMLVTPDDDIVASLRYSSQARRPGTRVLNPAHVGGVMVSGAYIYYLH